MLGFRPPANKVTSPVSRALDRTDHMALDLPALALSMPLADIYADVLSA